MFKSMYARLFALFMVIILAVLLLVSFFSYYTIRELNVNSRMEELKKEAREIAYLASQTRFSISDHFSKTQSVQNAYLQWKAKRIYDNFNAYIVVVDRQGRVMQNIEVFSQDNPDFAAALDMQEVSQMLMTALKGDEVQIQTTWQGGGGPVFIVAVPWLQDEIVLGAVFIHTSAQVIRAHTDMLFMQIAGIAILAMLASALVIWFYVHRITRPLTSMAKAAGKMAQGDFGVRAESSSLTEIDELAQAFNVMVEKLSELESSRREFVANVSHELRSPITSIGGYIEGMRDGTIAPEQQQQYLAIVSSETKRLSKLIADLLHLSRLEKDEVQLNMVNFDINELIRRVLIRRLSDIENKQLEMVIDIEEKALYVYADADRIEQVIVNLFDNAIKFTPEKGTITVETKQKENIVFLTIIDNGEGVSLRDKEHIFERFYTADKAHTSGKGTGLGLSICKRIAEQHGQTLVLLDTKEGAAFQLTLAKGEDASGRA